MPLTNTTFPASSSGWECTSEEVVNPVRVFSRSVSIPYGAFAQRDADGRFIFTGPPEWLHLPEGTVRFLSPAELNQDWRGLCSELSPEELEQIRYWNPQTVGEIIFNAWD